jgi:hypothetical protein
LLSNAAYDASPPTSRHHQQQQQQHIQQLQHIQQQQQQLINSFNHFQTMPVELISSEYDQQSSHLQQTQSFQSITSDLVQLIEPSATMTSNGSTIAQLLDSQATNDTSFVIKSKLSSVPTAILIRSLNSNHQLISVPIGHSLSLNNSNSINSSNISRPNNN